MLRMWKAETWVSVGMAALTVGTIAVSTVYQVGLRSRDLERHSSEIASLSEKLDPIPTDIAAMRVEVGALAYRLQRVETCLDRMQARP